MYLRYLPRILIVVHVITRLLRNEIYPLLVYYVLLVDFRCSNLSLASSKVEPMLSIAQVLQIEPATVFSFSLFLSKGVFVDNKR